MRLEALKKQEESEEGLVEESKLGSMRVEDEVDKNSNIVVANFDITAEPN